MDPMYESMHREVFGINNRANKPSTHGSGRIDYVFAVDMRGIGTASGQVANSLFSDHKIIRGIIRQ